MAKDILSYYGPDRGGSRGLSGLSRPMPRDVNGYRPPQGPTNVGDRKSPGLHGDNEGYCGEQNDGYEGRERHQSSGRPGLGGSTDCCTQGKH